MRVPHGANAVQIEVCFQRDCKTRAASPTVVGGPGRTVSLSADQLPAGTVLFWRARGLDRQRKVPGLQTALRRVTIIAPIVPITPTAPGPPQPTLSVEEIDARIASGDYAGLVTTALADTLVDRSRRELVAFKLAQVSRCREVVRMLDDPDPSGATPAAAQLQRDCYAGIALQDARDALARHDTDAALRSVNAFNQRYPRARDLLWTQARIHLEEGQCVSARSAADVARLNEAVKLIHADDPNELAAYGEARDFDNTEQAIVERCVLGRRPSGPMGLVVSAAGLGFGALSGDRSPTGAGFTVGIGFGGGVDLGFALTWALTAIDPGHLDPDGRISGVWGGSCTARLGGRRGRSGLIGDLMLIAGDGEFRNDDGREHGVAVVYLGGGLGYEHALGGGWSLGASALANVGTGFDYHSLSNADLDEIGGRFHFIKGASLRFAVTWRGIPE